MKRLFDKKFWLWQIVIVLLLVTIVFSYVYLKRHEFTSDSLYEMMEKGEEVFWRDYYECWVIGFGLMPALFIVITNILGVVIGYKYVTNEKGRKVLKWLGLLWGIYTMIILYMWSFLCISFF